MYICKLSNKKLEARLEGIKFNFSIKEKIFQKKNSLV